MYSLIYDKIVIRTLNKLPIELRERIANKLRVAKENPFHFFSRLSDRTDYKLRVGDYRIIADIDTSNQTITVTFVGHRKNVYEKM